MRQSYFCHAITTLVEYGTYRNITTICITFTALLVQSSCFEIPWGATCPKLGTRPSTQKSNPLPKSRPSGTAVCKMGDLEDVCLMGVHLTGVYLTGVHLIVVYLTGVHVFVNPKTVP
jgi:hypothetical protein